MRDWGRGRATAVWCWPVTISSLSSLKKRMSTSVSELRVPERQDRSLGRSRSYPTSRCRCSTGGGVQLCGSYHMPPLSGRKANVVSRLRVEMASMSAGTLSRVSHRSLAKTLKVKSPGHARTSTAASSGIVPFKSSRSSEEPILAKFMRICFWKGVRCGWSSIYPKRWSAESKSIETSRRLVRGRGRRVKARDVDRVYTAS